MGLGIELRASFDRGVPEDPLGTVEAWARWALPWATATVARDGERPSVRLALHPAAEDVEISLRESGQLVVSALTTTAGPGYHAFVVEDVMDRLAAALSLRWNPPEGDEGGDETGYFEGRDREELERQMLAWLRALASWLVSEPEGGFDVCLGFEGFEMPAFSRTPLGPRDRAYWQEVAEDPRRGSDFFAWWEPGRGAGYWRGIALALMWSDVRWREPDGDEDEGVLRRVADALERAYALDRAGAYPWAAWAEILDLLGDDGRLAGEVRARRAADAGLAIGYRRHPVRVALAGGWSMRLPGAMREDRDDEGTWWAHGAGREAWFSAFSSRAPRRMRDLATLLAEVSGKGAIRTFTDARDGLVAAAALREKDGASLVTSMVEVPGHLAVATFVLPSEDDVEWALDAWRSLRRAAPEGEGP